MLKELKFLALTGLMLLVSGALGLRGAEDIYQECCNHLVIDRPWDILFLASFFVTAFIMGIVQRVRYSPSGRLGRFASSLVLLWGVAAIVPAYFSALDILTYGHFNGPGSLPFIFTGRVLYAHIMVATLLLTSAFYLLISIRRSSGIYRMK